LNLLDIALLGGTMQRCYGPGQLLSAPGGKERERQKQKMYLCLLHFASPRAIMISQSKPPVNETWLKAAALEKHEIKKRRLHYAYRRF